MSMPALLSIALLLFQAADSTPHQEGETAVSLRATLASLYDDPYVSEHFAEIATPSEDRVDQLVVLLRDPREDVRQRAAALLARVDDGGRCLEPLSAVDELAAVRGARALGWFKSSLLLRVDSEDPILRFEGAYALADGSAESVFVLLDLLHHDNADVRAVAAEGIAWAIWTYPVRFDLPAVECHHRRTLDLAACVVVAEGLDEIEGALADQDVRVRRFAALVARKLGTRAEPLRLALAGAAKDADPSVRCLAGASLARIDAGPWPGLADLATLERSARPLAGTPRAELERLLREAAPWKLTRESKLPDESDLRFEAACELARADLAGLLASALTESIDGPARRVLDGMQTAVAEHVDLVLLAARRHDLDAVAAALALGTVVLPGLEYEVLRSGRFPYGWPMFDELALVLAGLGEPALPIVIEWLTADGEIARYKAADTLAALGPVALPAAPF
jgi:hypothetical protein